MHGKGHNMTCAEHLAQTCVAERLAMISQHLLSNVVQLADFGQQPYLFGGIQLNRLDVCRDHLPGHSYTYKSPAKRDAAAAAVDLSNATFSALEDQIEGLNEIRVSLTCTSASLICSKVAN